MEAAMVRSMQTLPKLEQLMLALLLSNNPPDIPGKAYNHAKHGKHASHLEWKPTKWEIISKPLAIKWEVFFENLKTSLMKPIKNSW
jgi:hypothetical protein